jgi:hypothetical protein
VSAPAAEPLYVRDGSRFVLYDPAAQHAPPIRRVPVPVDVDAVVERAEGGWAVPAPKCQHGHFARWASRNCCAPR